MNDILKQNLITALHLDALPAEEREKVLIDVGKVIYGKVLLRVLEELSDKDKDEFDKLLGVNPDDDEAIFKFLSGKVPNLDALVNDEVAEFKQSSLDFMDTVTKK